MDVTRNFEPALVSVITIFLNAEAFLDEAIRSVFEQTYPHWELILVDDGSSDQGSEIARRYADRSPGRVRYLEHPGHANRGMSASRNLGIANARGSLIALLDADDVWLPHKLHQQTEIIARHPDVGMVLGRSRYWFSWTGRPGDIQRDADVGLDVPPGTVIEPPGLLLVSYPLGTGAAPCPSDLLFRAELIERVGAFEEEFIGDLQLYEDQAFLAKVYLGEKVYVSGATWDLYRNHSSSCVMVVKKAGKYAAVRRYFLDWLGEYVTRKGVRDDDVLWAIWKSRWPYEHPILEAALRKSQLPLPVRRWVARRARRLLGVARPVQPLD